jgi:hypothetical protein
MRTFVGTKIVTATPMSREDYITYRGWQIPADEDGTDYGYLIEYQDSGPSNDTRHAGYISWSPEAVFEATYKQSGELPFSAALLLLKEGRKVCRAGWNGKDMFLFLVPGSTFTVNRPPLLGIYPEGTRVDYRPHIDMRTANGEIVPWVASQSDLLEDDWCVMQ